MGPNNDLLSTIIHFLRVVQVTWIVLQYLALWRQTRSTQPDLLKKSSTLYRADQHVSIIVPTLVLQDSLITAIRTWLVCNPKEVLIVTPEIDRQSVNAFMSKLRSAKVRMIQATAASKRVQMVDGLRHVTTELVIFADDDTWWGSRTLDALIASFEDPTIGGCGTLQRLRPHAHNFTMWEVFGSTRLAGRNLSLFAAACYNDDNIKTLSGRTAAYRTSILKSDAFTESFLKDYWKGHYTLKSGDDVFITAWIRRHAWRTFVDMSPDSEVVTTMQPDWRYTKQLIRWTRNSLRGLIRDFIAALHHPSRAAILQLLFTTFGSLLRPFCMLLELLCILSAAAFHSEHSSAVIPLIRDHVVFHIIMTFVEKLYYLSIMPAHVMWLPAIMIYEYVRNFFVFYAAITLHQSHW